MDLDLCYSVVDPGQLYSGLSRVTDVSKKEDLVAFDAERRAGDKQRILYN